MNNANKFYQALHRLQAEVDFIQVIKANRVSHLLHRMNLSDFHSKVVNHTKRYVINSITDDRQIDDTVDAAESKFSELTLPKDLHKFLDSFSPKSNQTDKRMFEDITRERFEIYQNNDQPGDETIKEVESSQDGNVSLTDIGVINILSPKSKGQLGNNQIDGMKS